MNKYPYFIYPDIIALRDKTVNDEEAARLKRKIAANIGDLPSLRIALGIDPLEFASFYPDLQSVKTTTLDTIDNFLSNYSSQKGESADIPYFTECKTEEPNPSEKNNFDDMEEEAANLIRNKKYEEALKIITYLNLNKSEKSVYFADQIRFLKKLILNEAKKSSANQQALKA